MNIIDAINTVITVLDQVSVAGYENERRMTQCFELLIKCNDALKSASKEHEKAGEGNGEN